VLNVDITGEAVVHFSEPDADGYRRSERHLRGDRLMLEILPSVSIEIEIDDLFR
jgi:hypothetical protein